MRVVGFCLVQGKSTARGTLGTLLGTPQLLRLKGLLRYWKALHHCLLCMSSQFLLLYMQPATSPLQSSVTNEVQSKPGSVMVLAPIQISGCIRISYFSVRIKAPGNLTINIFFQKQALLFCQTLIRLVGQIYTRCLVIRCISEGFSSVFLAFYRSN